MRRAPHFFRLRRISNSQDADAVAAGEQEHLRHRARVVSEDPAGRSLLFTTCGYWNVTGLNPLPLASSVSHARDAYAAAAGGRGACTPSSVVCSDPRNAHPLLTTCHCLCSKNLHPTPRELYMPTVRDAYTTAAGVRCTTAPCRNYRPYEHCGPIISFHNLLLVHCEGPGTRSAGIVCIDSARCLCSRCCCVWGLHRFECHLYRHVRRSRSVHNYSMFECQGCGPFPAESSFTITGGAHAVAAAFHLTSTPCRECRP